MTATKLWLIVCGFLAAVCGYWYFTANYRQNKINRLETQKKELELKISDLKQKNEDCNDKVAKYSAAQERAADKIEKVRTIVRTVKSDCDCWNVMLPDDVRKLLSGK